MISKNNLLTTKKRKMLWILNRKVIFWLIAVFFVVSQIYFTIQMSAVGAYLVSFENKEKELMKESQKISEELIFETSLTRAEQKSNGLGFVKPEMTIYIKEDEAVAKLP